MIVYLLLYRQIPQLIPTHSVIEQSHILANGTWKEQKGEQGECLETYKFQPTWLRDVNELMN